MQNFSTYRGFSVAEDFDGVWHVEYRDGGKFCGVDGEQPMTFASDEEAFAAIDAYKRHQNNRDTYAA